MGDYKSKLNAIAIFCFSVVVLIYQWLSGNLSFGASNPLLSQIILFLTSVGFFELLFQVSVFIYTRYLYKIIYRSIMIDGKWFYLQYIDKDGSYRTGYCEIEHTEENIIITGNGFILENNSFSNRWQSEIATIKNRQLILSYESIGLKGSHIIRKGVIFANLQGKPPSEIYGFWTDIATGESKGTIIFYKNKQKFEAEAKRVGYNLSEASVSEEYMSSKSIPPEIKK